MTEPIEVVPFLATKEERVRWIAEQMANNRWLMKRWRRREIADKWGVAVPTVQGYAAEAHRLIAVPPEERAELLTSLAHAMLDIAERARTSLSVVTGMPDFRAEIDALAKFAEFSSVVSPDGSIGEGKREPVTIQITYATDDEDAPKPPDGSPK